MIRQDLADPRRSEEPSTETVLLPLDQLYQPGNSRGLVVRGQQVELERQNDLGLRSRRLQPVRGVPCAERFLDATGKRDVLARIIVAPEDGRGLSQDIG